MEKTVSIRHFQQNMYKYLGELPLVITKYNKPTYRLVKYVSQEPESSDSVGHEEKPVENITRASVTTPDVQNSQ